MKQLLTFAILVVFSFSSCVSSKEKAETTYQEGVTMTKEAATASEKGDVKSAEDLHAKSIAKFQEALQTDSTHASARAAIAHAYFQTQQYKEALDWYAKANAIDGETATNFSEMGLSKIALGELTEGQQTLDKAVALDHSVVLRDNTIKALVDIGDRHFKKGAAEKEKGNAAEAKKEQEYAMNVLMLAYYYNNTRKDVAAKIAEYADEVGNYTVKVQYTKLSEQ